MGGPLINLIVISSKYNLGAIENNPTNFKTTLIIAIIKTIFDTQTSENPSPYTIFSLDIKRFLTEILLLYITYNL